MVVADNELLEPPLDTFADWIQGKLRMVSIAQGGKVSGAVADKRHDMVVKTGADDLSDHSGLGDWLVVWAQEFNVPVLRPEQIAPII